MASIAIMIAGEALNAATFICGNLLALCPAMAKPRKKRKRGTTRPLRLIRPLMPNTRATAPNVLTV